MYLSKMDQTGCERCGRRKQTLNKATWLFKCVRHIPDTVLIDNLVQHQCQIKSFHHGHFLFTLDETQGLAISYFLSTITLTPTDL